MCLMAARVGTPCARVKAEGLPQGRVQFAFVKSWDVLYGSQQSVRHNIAATALSDNAQTRLMSPSKSTHTPTRERRVDRLMERQVFVEEQIDKLAQLAF